MSFSRSRRGDWPDMELLFASGSMIDEPMLKENFGIANDVWSAVYEPYVG